MKGIVIACEGLDGSGKSTHARLLARELCSLGRTARVFGLNDNPHLNKQWSILNQNDLIGPVEAALMQSAELLGRLEYSIRPLIQERAVVIWDKYVAGSLATFLVREVPAQYLEILRRTLPEPDLTLFFDVSPEEALSRKQRSGGPGFFESGLDRSLGLPLREAYTKWEKGELDPDLVAQHFKLFQANLRKAYEVFLPVKDILRFDSTGQIRKLANKVCACVREFISHIPAN